MAPITDTYESRVAKDAAIIMRRDPVVYTDLAQNPGPGANREQLEAYKRDGFMLLEGFLSERETKALLAEVEKMAGDPKISSREEAIREPGGNIVRSVFRVHEINHTLSRLARDRRLVNIARQVLGSDVYIHQSRANLKPGLFGKEFYWHSDFETWHVEDGMPNMRAVSCSILLTDNYEHNGPLMIIPGSHQYFISCVGETPANHYKQSLRKTKDVEVRYVRQHGSNSNISPYPRSNVFFVYNSVENTLNSPKHGLNPRPEHVATREDFSAIKPIEPGYLRDVSKGTREQ